MFDFRFADVTHVSFTSLLAERSIEDPPAPNRSTTQETTEAPIGHIDPPKQGGSPDCNPDSREPGPVADWWCKRESDNDFSVTAVDETHGAYEEPSAGSSDDAADVSDVPTRGCAPVGAPADFLPWRAPSSVFSHHVSDGSRSVVFATSMGQALPQLSGAELSGAMEDVDLLRARTEMLTLRVVLAAIDQRVHTDVGLALRDWVTQRCPFLSPHQIGDLITVAQGVGDPEHTGIAFKVFAAQLPLRRAAAVLRALRRVKPMLDTTPYAQNEHDSDTDTNPDPDPDSDPDPDPDPDPDSGSDGEAPPVSETDATVSGMGVSEYQDAIHLMLGVATQPRFNDRDLRRVTDRLTNTVLPDKDHEQRAKAARSMRCVNESALADGSLVRFVVTCDPEGAALIRSVLSSPLAAPSPDETGPDPRTAGQRRYDALMTVVRRGIAGGDQMPTTAKATLNVTVRWDALLRALVGSGGTSTGEELTPATVRRVACDADVVPMVLGTDGEILDQGRAKRLVTPGQRRALEHRDKGCTFPGCSIPASWTDAHHVIHWSRGGLSNLDNYALLCGRHHTIVHDKDLTATVHSTGVTWHV